MAVNAKTEMASPALEQAVASALHKKFPALDIHQDDFGHANYGVYIQLTGDTHSGAYAMLAHDEETWAMEVYSTNHDDALYSVDLSELKAPYTTSGGKPAGSSVGKIVLTVQPHIQEALKYSFDVVRPLSADLAAALGDQRDENGHHRFTHINAYEGRPSGVFAMLDGTRALFVWLEKGEWRAHIEDINHKDWKGAEQDLGSFNSQTPIAVMAIEVAQLYEKVKANLNPILATWHELQTYLGDLGRQDDRELFPTPSEQDLV
jgi:hypothetical protein